MSNIIKRTISQIAERMLPDNQSFTNRFQIRSETSNSLYTVAQSKSGRWWSCSCPGWIRHRKCKHLEALGLPCGKHLPPYEVGRLSDGKKKPD